MLLSDSRDRQETPIGRLAHRWMVDNCPTDCIENEQETADRSDRIADALESLMKLSATNWMDAEAKLLVLSIRLRQTATTADPESLLLAHLAASIQHDLVRLRL
ncbi:hypothetical protein [Azospirillum lipoferum]|uniref:Uncharacterized protein n=1 Tax=Azospirillum lipoferum (strain 4B) TaxID=862719 RepID=G7ZB50_AZOL4|nr:hypothetical protein [Azospirillum lipoferum]CBS88434.1 protein of unknown function [Azospirillum lipoferum 4B]